MYIHLFFVIFNNNIVIDHFCKKNLFVIGLLIDNVAIKMINKCKLCVFYFFINPQKHRTFEFNN